MADFSFQLLTHSPERTNVISAKLGATANAKFTTADVYKAVTLGPVGNYVLAADGADLEGFCDSVDSATANGFSFGGVARPDPGFRVEAIVSGAAVVVGDQVIAGPQTALNTYTLTNPAIGFSKRSYPVVKKGVGAVFKYRVINLYTGAGAAGTVVLLERC